MEAAVLSGGFSDPALQSARAFRAIMDAMARPGRTYILDGGHGPDGLSRAAASAVLTLCDPDTGLYLAPSHDTPDLRRWVTFHTSAPLVSQSEASFALGAWDSLSPLDPYPIGTPEYPDRSTTLIVERAGLGDGVAVRLSGPGIETTQDAHLPDAGPFVRNAALYPLGVDALFTSEDQVMALPRSTQVEVL
ncbi:MAG: phosphonate C-P lyase system protein PhnH [Pseudomonadota bacterium]